MFQHFKSILPISNIRSISSSVGINEEEWRTRGLERLEALKTEFQNLNTLFLNKVEASQQTESLSDATENTNAALSLEDTAKLIKRFQTDWKMIHDTNDTNFRKAKMADRVMRDLLEQCAQHCRVSQAVESSSSTLQSMQTELNSITNIAADLRTRLEILEDRVNAATLGSERIEFEEWKQEQEANLEQEMKEKRLELKRREAALKAAFEEHNRTQTQKRVELYEAAFNAELEEYRRKRETQVSSLYSHEKSRRGSIITSLQTLQLEDVAGDDQDLDKFLDDAAQAAACSQDSNTNEHREDNVQSTRQPKAAKPCESEESDSEEIEIMGDEDFEEE
ncbi:hypothetical protein VTP01DRAFT_10148 [Rhizomucor pusillus]|uniref:uncharacterized protein n=1 Tax=Rhizomucor pusillus TaxID=4840 RepID=UPI0037443595